MYFAIGGTNRCWDCKDPSPRKKARASE